MKNLLIVSTLALLPMLCIAEDWKYELDDALVKRIDSDGSERYSVDMMVVDYYIKRIRRHAWQYPPKFASEEQQVEVTDKLRRLLKLLEMMGQTPQASVDSQFLARAAYSNSMGHNADIKGAAERARHYYGKLLEVSPDSVTANYEYCMFLAGTRVSHFDSIPYLEKALALGNDDARYTLGLILVRQGNTKKGLEMLEQYSSDHPDNERVKSMIEAVHAGTLKIKSN